MDPDAEEDQIASVGDWIDGHQAVESADFVDKDTALSEFGDLFADQPEMLEQVTADILPTSYRLVVCGDADLLEADLGGLDGVKDVVQESREEMNRPSELPSEPFMEWYESLPRVLNVFVEPDLPETYDLIGALIVGLAPNRDVRWIDQAGAAEEFACLFDTTDVDEETLPPYFRVAVDQDDPEFATLFGSLRSLEGVKEVVVAVSPEALVAESPWGESLGVGDDLSCRVDGEPVHA